jgi:hypothetical protein
MAFETHVTLTLDSASLFKAFQMQVGDWTLRDHAFDPTADEVHMSYDSAGSGRIAVTVAFELTEAQMAELLRLAQPAG